MNPLRSELLFHAFGVLSELLFHAFGVLEVYTCQCDVWNSIYSM